jgi:hydrogenase expression/formation protein HypC
MCLAVPGRVSEVWTEAAIHMGKVSFAGVVRRVCMEYLPDVQPGEYVLVHVGFALSRVDEAEAQRMLEVLRELDALELSPQQGRSS